MKDDVKGDQICRVLQIYSKLLDGYVVSKAEEATRYGVNERSIQRDIDHIRNFLDEDSERTGIVNTIVYDRIKKGYRLETIYQMRLQNSEVLALCKILLDSRAFALFMKVYDADMAQLHARVDRLENVVAQQIQQPAQPARVVEYVPEKEEKPDAKPSKPRTIRPDINAKFGGKYKIISAKEPDKALSVFYDRSFMGGLNSMNRTLELVSKNNLHVATWTVESCGPNIYRLVETSSGLVIEYEPASGNTTTLFVKKWRERPSCIWEIRENRDKTVSFLSNADVEKGLKCGRGNRVGVGKTGLKDSRWILERV